METTRISARNGLVQGSGFVARAVELIASVENAVLHQLRQRVIDPTFIEVAIGVLDV
jgi:hypothetical protein